MQEDDRTGKELMRELAELRRQLLNMKTEKNKSDNLIARLRDTGERYRSLVENLPDVVLTFDCESKITYVSPNVEKVLGYTPQEVYLFDGGSLEEKIHPQDCERVKGGRVLLFVRNQKFDVEYRIRKKNGNWAWVHDRAVTTYKREGLLYADGLLSEVTERKKIDALEAKAREGYQAIFASASEGIFCFEAEEPIPLELGEDEMIKRMYATGRLVECNDALARMYGLENKEKLIGARIEQFNPSANEKNIEYLRTFIRNGFRLHEYLTHEADAQGRVHSFRNNLIGVVKDSHLVRTWGTQREVTE